MFCQFKASEKKKFELEGSMNNKCEVVPIRENKKTETDEGTKTRGNL